MGLTKKQENLIKKDIFHLGVIETSKKHKVSQDSVIEFVKSKFNKLQINNLLNFLHIKKELKIGEILHENILFLFGLLVLVFVLYVNAIPNEFVSDDRYNILLNEEFGTLKYIFSIPVFFFSKLPQGVLVNIFGKTPEILRLLNIFYHVVSSFSVFFIGYKLFNKQTALIASLLFAVHPLMVESITWISGYTSSQYSALFLVAFTLYLFSNFKDKKYYFSIILVFLAVSSSNRAFVVPLIFVAYEYLVNKQIFTKRLIPFYLIFILFFSVNFLSLGARTTDLKQTYYAEDSTNTNIFVLVPVAVTEYLKLTVYPTNLTIYHSELSTSQNAYILRLLIFFIISILSLLAFKKHKKIFFFILLFFIALSPTLTPFGVSWVVAERYVYLSLVGLFLILGFLLSVLYTKNKYLKYSIIIFVISISIVFSVLTIKRNLDWRSPDSLWVATSLTSPSSPNTHNNLGDVYGRRGEFDKSIEEFKKAIELKPGYADAYHNLANTYAQIGNIDEAIINYQKALEFNPNLWQSHTQLASLYFNMQDFESASLHLKSALEITNGDINIALSLAQVYTSLNNLAEAKLIYNSILQVDPLNQFALEGIDNVKTLETKINSQ